MMRRVGNQDSLDTQCWSTTFLTLLVCWPVQDFDGLIGRFSGSEVPSTLSTDTGLLRVNFTADGSLQEKGFAAAYLASSTPQVYIPTCTDGAKLVQVRRAASI